MDHDSLMVRDIKHALEEELQQDAMDINVESKNGNVHLSGLVDSLRDKLIAEEIVKQFDIHKLENNITISMDGSISDKELKERIEMNLRKGPNSMNLKNVGVQVEGGSATLIGQVRSLADEIAALEITRGVEGIKHTASILNIGSQDFIFDDASLVNRIEDALANSALVGTTRIKIAVDHGIATLTGTVEKPYEIEIAGELAAHVEGIQKVKNELELPTRQNR